MTWDWPSFIIGILVGWAWITLALTAWVWWRGRGGGFTVRWYE